MKKTKILLLYVIACLFICSSLYAKSDYGLYVKNQVYKKQKAVPLVTFPECLQKACDNGAEEYRVIIYGYSEDISNARTIRVKKIFSTDDKRLEKQYYIYRGDTVLAQIEKDLEKACKELPVVTTQTINGEFNYTVYDGEKYAKELHVVSLFGVLRHNNRIIWYGSQGGEKTILSERTLPLVDIKQLDDGRYLIVTDDAEYYVEDQGERLVAEVYAGKRTIVKPKKDYPVYRILTDNVVRQSYDDGSVEHWKIVLSDEDIEKNREKWREQHTRKNGDFEKLSAGDKHLLWWNGVGKRRSVMDDTHIQAMWCYQEGGPEPTAESYSEISLAKTGSGRGAEDKNFVAKAAQSEKAETSAATGWFGSLVARVKGFFAGLFS